MIERIAIDTTCHRVLEEPAAGPGPEASVCYTDPRIQSLVRRSFGDLLPFIRQAEAGLPYYESFDEESRETCCLTRHASSPRDIPAEEVMRLAEGWRRLQQAARDPNLDGKLRALIQGFQLPNPVTELHLYRLYADGSGRTRLHVFWGYAEPDGRSAPTSAGQAVGFLLSRLSQTERLRMENVPATQARTPTTLLTTRHPTGSSWIRLGRVLPNLAAALAACRFLAGRIRVGFSRLRTNIPSIRRHFFKRNDGKDGEFSEKYACSRN